MNENFTTTESLIQYLDGELDEIKAREIKISIDENEQLQKEVDGLRIAKDAIANYGIKNKVASIHKEMMLEMAEEPAQTGVVRSMMWYGLRIAAMVIFVTGAFIAYQYYAATSQKLYSDNFSSFKIHDVRGTAPSALQSAYQQNNMQSVVSQFQLLQQPSAEDYFFAGNAYLDTDQPSKAITTFELLQQKNKTDNTHYYEEDTEYYLAMGYLANNNGAKALPLLEKINADVNHPYHQFVGRWLLTKLHRITSK